MINIDLAFAGLALGYDNSFTVESDGTMWIGSDDDRQYLSDIEVEKVKNKVLETENEKAIKRNNVLEKLGLTADEVAALIS